ncbi:MAG: ankyrin repeat domain-containing protein, partial [Acidobacteria bacterium]|nr:ankyrin repeat domain-containing protein [Acidobacteriota bacterium]
IVMWNSQWVMTAAAPRGSSLYCCLCLMPAYAKNVEILKRLKPDAKRDDLDNLLACAATFGRVETVRSLLDLGAQPNDKPNGGFHGSGQMFVFEFGI